mmetsp:Transcript_49995/g.88030  ORF Transcript_49995/g.88030 Transcript_49995/m.88030 type:complete len:380 (+) Transcript_49995:448-1587(+)
MGSSGSGCRLPAPGPIHLSWRMALTSSDLWNRFTNDLISGNWKSSSLLERQRRTSLITPFKAPNTSPSPAGWELAWSSCSSSSCNLFSTSACFSMNWRAASSRSFSLTSTISGSLLGEGPSSGSMSSKPVGPTLGTSTAFTISSSSSRNLEAAAAEAAAASAAASARAAACLLASIALLSPGVRCRYSVTGCPSCCGGASPASSFRRSFTSPMSRLSARTSSTTACKSSDVSSIFAARPSSLPAAAPTAAPVATPPAAVPPAPNDVWVPPPPDARFFLSFAPLPPSTAAASAASAASFACSLSTMFSTRLSTHCKLSGRCSALPATVDQSTPSRARIRFSWFSIRSPNPSISFSRASTCESLSSCAATMPAMRGDTSSA